MYSTAEQLRVCTDIVERDPQRARKIREDGMANLGVVSPTTNKTKLMSYKNASLLRKFIITGTSPSYAPNARTTSRTPKNM